MQRTAENDLIGHILAHEFNGIHVCLPYIHVCLPYEFEPKHPHAFIRSKNGGKTFDMPVIRKTDSRLGKTCRIRIPQDPGAGKFVAHQLAKKLASYGVFVEPEHAAKTLRAAPFAAACENKFTVLVEAPWNSAFIEELCAFPNGGYDDQVDAVLPHPALACAG